MGSNQEDEGCDEMKKLLEELKQLDPACYEDIRRRVIYAMDEDFKLYVTNQTFRENVDDTIQGCVQRVVAARGWRVIILSAPDHARVVIDETVDGMGGTRKIVELEASSPAKAILTAYIAARKAQP